MTKINLKTQYDKKIFIETYYKTEIDNAGGCRETIKKNGAPLLAKPAETQEGLTEIVCTAFAMHDGQMDLEIAREICHHACEPVYTEDKTIGGGAGEYFRCGYCSGQKKPE